MKAVMLMFDTLSRDLLPAYGGDVHAPNFERLQMKTVTFDQCWVGSMPCIPARREIHTGRYNFLHRRWGPLEPFDESMPQTLKENGVYTHLVTDHQHYWEDGGSTYHNRYNSYEFIRGQEGDFWIGEVKDPERPDYIGGHHLDTLMRHDFINRTYIKEEKDFPLVKTVNKGLNFIDLNKNEDNWFLQIECFDPHEPFYVSEKYKDLYPDDYDGPLFDWPSYGKVKETDEEVEHISNNYKALITMCDHYLGKVLDKFDELNLWEDTLLVVNTDHGLLMGEHDSWGKCVQPFYNEVARIPLFVWDPRYRISNARSDQLVQNIDIAPTLLDFFGVPISEYVQGKPLREVYENQEKTREAVLFGVHGGHVNITDGDFVYMRGPASQDNMPLFNYTLMPTKMRGFLEEDELKRAELSEPFPFTKEMKTLKVNTNGDMGLLKADMDKFGTFLFDIKNDPNQADPLEDPEVEIRLIKQMVELMVENDTPMEQFERLGLKHYTKNNENKDDLLWQSK